MPILLDQNLPIVTLWAACKTQWRVGFGAVVGLDYPAMFQVAAALKITVDEAVFRGIQLLEDAQLALWNKKDKGQDNEPSRNKNRYSGR
jgi:hypothetical protein